MKYQRICGICPTL